MNENEVWVDAGDALHAIALRYKAIPDCALEDLNEVSKTAICDRIRAGSLPWRSQHFESWISDVIDSAITDLATVIPNPNGELAFWHDLLGLYTQSNNFEVDILLGECITGDFEYVTLDLLKNRKFLFKALGVQFQLSSFADARTCKIIYYSCRIRCPGRQCSNTSIIDARLCRPFGRAQQAVNW